MRCLYFYFINFYTSTSLNTPPFNSNYIRWNDTVTPAVTIATMLISLIKIFKLGPAVSLNGSPTVSPIIAALCASEPIPP